MLKKIICFVCVFSFMFIIMSVHCFAFVGSGDVGDNYVVGDIPFTFYGSEEYYDIMLPSVNISSGSTAEASSNGVAVHSVSYPEYFLEGVEFIDNYAYTEYNVFNMVSFINLDSLQNLPQYPIITVDPGYVISTSIDDYDTYGLSSNCVEFTYILPKGFDLSSFYAGCSVSFDTFYKSVGSGSGGGSSVDYSSENVITTISTNGLGSSYISLEGRDFEEFEYSNTLYPLIYDNYDLYQFFTVKIYPFALLQEFTHSFQVGDSLEYGFVVENFSLSPYLEIREVVEAENSFYEWAGGNVDSTLIDEFIEVGNEIIAGNDYCVSFTVQDSDLNNDYQSSNNLNYLRFMGGDVDVTVVGLDDFNLVDWLGDTMGGVLDTKIFGTVSLGTVLYVCVGVGLAFVILKFFVGG